MSCHMARWYTTLITLLSAQTPETPELTVSLSELELLVGGPLPLSAYGRNLWTTTGSGKISAPIMRVGWRVSHFDRDMRAVTFVRAA